MIKAVSVQEIKELETTRWYEIQIRMSSQKLVKTRCSCRVHVGLQNRQDGHSGRKGVSYGVKQSCYDTMILLLSVAN